MKTAIELADEFPEQNLANIEPDAANILNGWGIEAVAMLLKQAEQIKLLHEAMRDEMDEGLRLRELGGAKPDENITAMTERVIKERDALKADAKRFMTLAEYLVSDRTECDDAIVDARTVEQLRAAIDAMKGKS